MGLIYSTHGGGEVVPWRKPEALLLEGGEIPAGQADGLCPPQGEWADGRLGSYNSAVKQDSGR